VLSDLPFFTDLHQERRDQQKARRFVWKDADHPGTPADLFVDPLQAVGRSDGTPMVQRKIEDRKSFRYVFLQPGRQAWCRDRVLLDGGLQECLCRQSIWGVEHGANISSHFQAHRLFGQICSSILLEVELAPLPGDHRPTPLAWPLPSLRGLHWLLTSHQSGSKPPVNICWQSAP
jgi:hypothetical protein